MADEFQIVPNKKAKAAVWGHFGFVKIKEETSFDKIACRHCRTVLKYSGNTSNLNDHIKRKHPSLSSLSSAAAPPTEKSYATCTKSSDITAFFTKVPAHSQRGKDISQSILQFIVKDLRPFSVVENNGFKNMINVLEPRYTIPSRQFFSDTAMPKLYEEVKSSVQSELRNAVSVALTTDGWTSRATESYVTITSSHIDDDYRMRSFVLQTRAMPESHTGVNIANVLTEAVQEWKLPSDPPLVTDNASNMVVAASEAGLTYHLGCFAHTLNLACGKALKVDRVSRLLARMRRIVAYFHRSAIATAMLKEKQKLLGLPSHKLVIDVQTRWNSALDMISRFLEQQSAVYSVLLSKEIRGKDSDITSITDSDLTDAEDLIAILTPLKMATVALCEESVPTSSIILPIQYHLLNVIMRENDTDRGLIKLVKQAVSNDLKARYTSERQRELLCMASLLDPRFKQVPFLTEEQKLEAFHKLTMSTVNKQQKVVVKSEPEDATQGQVLPALPTAPNLPVTARVEEPAHSTVDVVDDDTPPLAKKPAMASLLGDVYIVKVEKALSLEDRVSNEITNYKLEAPIPTNDNPLEWWKHHQNKFPLLSAMAKTFLCIPATSVPSERVFSTAGDIVTAQRSALRSENVDKLIFLKKNWKV